MNYGRGWVVAIIMLMLMPMLRSCILRTASDGQSAIDVDRREIGLESFFSVRVSRILERSNGGAGLGLLCELRWAPVKPERGVTCSTQTEL